MLKVVLSFMLVAPIISSHCAVVVTNKNPQTKVTQQHEISANYVALLNDLRWFFKGLEEFSIVAERLLPNITSKGNARTFSESTRINVLLGLRHIAQGVKEVSSNFRRSLEIENMQQVEQIKQATNFIHEVIKTLKEWLTALRVLVAQILRLYNRYMPEVLLGKCLSRYIADVYPDRIFYEYPFLLLSEMTFDVWESLKIGSDNVANENVNSEPTTSDPIEAAVGVTEEYPRIEQNEIPYNDAEDSALKAQNSSSEARKITVSTDPGVEGFFNLYDVILEDKEEVIESAIKRHSWQKCFKLYTAESIVRRLKKYFLEIE